MSDNNSPDNKNDMQNMSFEEAVSVVMRKMIKGWRLHDCVLDRVTLKQGIYKSQLKMLSHIFHHEGISQRELAQQLEISPPSIAVTAKRLEKLGYISRQMDEKDNRMNILNTTEEGRAILGRTWQEYIGIDQRMFKGFSNEELEIIARFYARLEENLWEVAGEVDPESVKNKRK